MKGVTLTSGLVSLLALHGLSHAQLVLDFEPTDPTEVPGDGGFFDMVANPNTPDFSGGFGNSLFDQYAGLEFINSWVTPSNSSFPASSGSFKLQTFAGPGPDTVIRSVGRPIESMKFTLTSNGSAAILIDGSFVRGIGDNRGSFRSEDIFLPGLQPFTEVRFRPQAGPPAGFFSIDQLEINFAREQMAWNSTQSGPFENPLAWTLIGDTEARPAGIPSVDDLIFAQDVKYTVEFQEPRDLASIEVQQGIVTIDLADGMSSVQESLTVTSGSLIINATAATELTVGSVTSSGHLLIQGETGQGGVEVNVTGDFTLTPESVLEVELLSADNGRGEAATFVVDGIAQLDGTLRITRADGYMACAGEFFRILEADEIRGIAGTDPLIRGFVTVEGLRDTDNEDVFFGIDYNTTPDSNPDTLDIVVLEVPQRWTPVGDPTPVTSGPLPDNIIFITHGNRDTIVESTAEDGFDDIAAALATFVASHNLQGDFDIITLNWGQFSTATTGNVEDIDRRWIPFGSDFLQYISVNGEISFYESARFGQQYGRILIDYLSAGLGDEPGSPILSSPSGLSSVHFIAHSNGNYVADSFFDVLASNSLLSPYGRSLPGVRFHTGLDVHLPPQTGSAVDVAGVSIVLGGDSLGDLANNTTDTEQYFTEGLLGTNNHPQFASDSSANYEITGYVGRFPEIGFNDLPPFAVAVGRHIDSHKESVKFYLDTITAHLQPSVAPLLQPFGLLTSANVDFIRKNTGFARSPLATAAGITPAELSLSPNEFDDGDIDLVRPADLFTTLPPFPLPPAPPSTVVVTISGVWEQDPQTGVISGSTQSPAVATLIVPVDEAPVNILGLDLSLESDQGGFVSVFVENEIVLDLPVSPGSSFTDEVEIDLLPFAETLDEKLSITFRLEPLDDGFINAQIEGLSVGLFRLDTVAPSGCKADINDDGLLDLADVVAFLEAFLAMDPIVDFDGNQLFDLADIVTFVDSFSAGCP